MRDVNKLPSLLCWRWWCMFSCFWSLLTYQGSDKWFFSQCWGSLQGITT